MFTSACSTSRLVEDEMVYFSEYPWSFACPISARAHRFEHSVSRGWPSFERLRAETLKGGRSGSRGVGLEVCSPVWLPVPPPLPVVLRCEEGRSPSYALPPAAWRRLPPCLPDQDELRTLKCGSETNPFSLMLFLLGISLQCREKWPTWCLSFKDACSGKVPNPTPVWTVNHQEEPEAQATMAGVPGVRNSHFTAWMNEPWSFLCP